MHTGIYGITRSGKSSLSKVLCRGSRRQGRTCAVLDPKGEQWPASWQSDDVAHFLFFCQTNPGLTIFVDESGDVFEHQRDRLNWLATRGGSLGHQCFFIAQRAAQIPKTVRDQCDVIYLFASSRSDSEMHADEWNRPELAEAYRLPKLHCFRTGRFEEVQAWRVDPIRGELHLVRKPVLATIPEAK